MEQTKQLVKTITEGIQEKKSLSCSLSDHFCWGTRTRTKNDRTRICSVTITPYPNESLQFSFAGAKVLLFLELPKLFGEKFSKE